MSVARNIPPATIDQTRDNYTIEDFLKLPSGKRYGLIEGRLIQFAMSGTGDEHGRISGELFFRLYGFVKQHKLGFVYPQETAFDLTPADFKPVKGKRGRPKGTSLCPDIGFVRADRLQPVTKGAVPVAPDLAIEILSGSQETGKGREEIDLKTQKYLDAGVPLIWIINALNRTVEIYQAEAGPETRRGEQELDAGDVVPGFKVQVSELFDF